MSSEAAIQRGRGLVSNPAFFMIFLIAAAMGIAGVMTIGISGVWGWVLVAIEGVLFAVAALTGLGEKLFVGLIALFGLFGGAVSTYVVFYLWGPMHEQYLWAGLLSLLIVVLPVASIAGERVLPLFVAFLAGVWGVISVIVLVMVLFHVGLEP